jgi:TIR domain
MLPTAPTITFLTTTQDIPFLHTLFPHLSQRGLQCIYYTTEQPLPSSLEQSALCVCIISRASLASSAMQAAWNAVLQTKTTVIPLRTEFGVALPSSLASLQWVDFSQNFEIGWQQLLVVLDSLGIAAFPMPPVPVLDRDVVHARLSSGHIPPDWTVYRRLQQVRQRDVPLSELTGLLTLVALMPFSIFSYINFGLSVGIISFLLSCALAMGIFFFSRFPKYIYVRDGECIAVTPNGAFLRLQDKEICISFHAIASIGGSISAKDGSPYLHITPNDTGQPYDVLLPRQFGLRGIIAQRVVATHRAFLQRYRAHKNAATPIVEPMIFISYSRVDSAIVDILEDNILSRNLGVWVDRSRLSGGQYWEEEIFRAIDEAQAVMLVISPDALRSKIVQKEWAYALQSNKPIIGVLARPTRGIPSPVRQRIAINFHQYLIRALMQLQLALDDAGLYATQPNILLPLSGASIMAHAMRGEVPSDRHIHISRFPTGIWKNISLPFLPALIITAYFIPLHPREAIAFFASAAWIWLVNWSRIIVKKFRVPEAIVTTPAGLAMIWRNNALLELAYQQCEQIKVEANTFGVTITSMVKGTRRLQILRLESHFPHSQAIAQQINSDFAQFRSSQLAATASK